MKGYIKKIITLIMLSLLVVETVIAANTSTSTDTIALTTSFTYSQSSYFGFSKRKITTLAPVLSGDKFNVNVPIQCSFDPDQSAYISPVFYVYAQVFSPNKITLTIEAPLKMEDKDPNVKLPEKNIDYSISSAVLGKWVDGVNRKYTFTEPAKTDTTKSRVYCEPIQISVPSAKVIYGHTYDLKMTVKVSGV